MIVEYCERPSIHVAAAAAAAATAAVTANQKSRPPLAAAAVDGSAAGAAYAAAVPSMATMVLNFPRAASRVSSSVSSCQHQIGYFVGLQCLAGQLCGWEALERPGGMHCCTGPECREGNPLLVTYQQRGRKYKLAYRSRELPTFGSVFGRRASSCSRAATAVSTRGGRNRAFRRCRCRHPSTQPVDKRTSNR